VAVEARRLADADVPLEDVAAVAEAGTA
jgi:hypothetical protein